ncbi:MAG: hypothetical protein DRN06_07240 [Thermoprotei archaeon]|nr:MAG: hypothetical protein DRN06_07240 [Thermoprotei archaeon]
MYNTKEKKKEKGGDGGMGIEGAKTNYINKMASAYTNDHYAKAMAEFLGVDVSRIAASGPVKNWKDKFDTDADRKARADKWETNLKAAFGIA